MTEHGDIRRALEELSSHPPVRDRKREVQERIAVVRRRHNIIGGITLSVLMLFVGIAFAARPTGRGQGADADAAISIGPSPEPAPGAPSPSPAAAAYASSPRPDAAASVTEQIAPPADSTDGPAGLSAAVTPTAAAKPSRPAPTTVRPQTTTTTVYLPPPPITTTPAASPTLPTSTVTPTLPVSGSPSVSPSASSTATPSTSPTPPVDAETLAVEIQSSTVADGTLSPETTLTIRIRGSLYGSMESITLWFTTIHHLAFTQSVPPRTCVVQTGELRQIDETFTVKTRYRVAGDQQVDVGINSLNAACARDTTQRQWLLSGTVNVPVGSTLSNGVAPIALFLEPARVEASKITIAARSADPDGYASGFEVNWGTGAAQTYPSGNTSDCRASEVGGKFWPGGGGSGTFTSPVLPAGSYTVSVTATSTGCDGKDPQTTVQTVTVTIP
ncbi:MAG: hypothetical protein ABIM89_16730 [Mycobacteriales bacterium]